MKMPIFGQDEIRAWRRALIAQPAPLAETELPAAPQVEAFAPKAMTVGMAFRMRCRDKSEFEFIINPVAARHLAAAILTMGQQAGWLDENNDITSPPVRLDS